MIIKPVSDLRNNFTEISKIVHEEEQPVFLTKNGVGDMVVMSMEQYNQYAKMDSYKIDMIAREVLERYRGAFEELAK